MAIEYSGSWDYPEDFSDDEKMDHVQLMNETLAVLLAIYDQIEKADSIMHSTLDISAEEYSALSSQFEEVSRELRQQIVAAKPWLGPIKLADFDKRLPIKLSKEYEELIFEYSTYRTLLGKSE